MVEVRVGAAGTPLDGCLIPYPLSITHGRSEIATQPNPPSMDFEWWDADPPPGVFGNPLTLGDLVQVWDTIHTLPAVYDDPVVPYDSAGSVYDSTATGVVSVQHYEGQVAKIEATGHSGEVQAWRIGTVGVLARWGVTNVKVTRPAENDVNRVHALMNAVTLPHTLKIDGLPGAMLAAADIDTDMLSAVHDVCMSSGGLLWQARNGDIHYTTSKYRPANQRPDLAIDACVILDAPSWAQQIDDIVNSVTIAYGPTTARGETTITDEDSTTQPWGTRHLAVDTTLATEPDAEALGALIVARRAFPWWGSLAVSTVYDDEAELAAGVADVNTVALLPIPRDPGPTPSDPTPWVVEGWVETWDENGEHAAVIAVSDQRRWVTTTLRKYSEVLGGGLTFGPDQSTFTTQTYGNVDLGGSYSVGRDVTCTADGRITGLRFNRPTTAVATTTTMRLWNTAGTLLGTATSTADTGSGWITILLPTPVDVAAGTTVRVSLDVPDGLTVQVTGGAVPANGDLVMTATSYYVTPAGTRPTTTAAAAYVADVVFQAADIAVENTYQYWLNQGDYIAMMVKEA